MRLGHCKKTSMSLEGPLKIVDGRGKFQMFPHLGSVALNIMLECSWWNTFCQHSVQRLTSKMCTKCQIEKLFL